MLDRLALWLSTYALHSTLLLLSAWWLARVFPAGRERFWRLALCGGLVTATLHTGGWWPRPAYLELPGLAPPGRESAATASGDGVQAAAVASGEALSQQHLATRVGSPARAASESSMNGSRPATAVDSAAVA
jgi:hypothetical protein